jgi:putative IMPACT (imprinted ancient) family translation regulator
LISHTSDDGEPSGTAGRPALAVLQGSGLGDVAVVITRYFGGTKLGKGGLVRAYGDAVREILKITPLAKKVTTHVVKFTIPYSLYERVRILIRSHQGKMLEESFLEEVTMTCQLLEDVVVVFNRELKELSHGKISANIIDTDDATILKTET